MGYIPYEIKYLFTLRFWANKQLTQDNNTANLTFSKAL